MKFCDSRTKFIFTENQKYIENRMCKSFNGLTKKPIYFDYPPTYENGVQLLEYPADI